MHTRIFVGLLILTFGFNSSDERRQPMTEATSLVLEHVTVIDATGSPIRTDMTVAITGGRISEIGDAKSTHFTKDAQTIDARNKFVIPGLWDMHAHVLTDKAEMLLPMLVANGITGAREMGNDSDVPIAAMDSIRKRVEHGTLVGPRVLMAGHILDGPKPVLPSNVALNSEPQARQTVVTLKKSGVDFIKVYTALPKDLYLAIADEAEEAGPSLRWSRANFRNSRRGIRRRAEEF